MPPRTRPLNPRTGRPRRALRAQVIAEETHCWICLLPVPKGVAYPNPLRESVDEVIPISLGGRADVRSNCRLAHAHCNNARSNRPVTDALRLRCRTHIAALLDTTRPTLNRW